ncbi:MAG TPA: phosphoenolpyruvate synthase [Candidatus Thermoplasmatota archaeon]|jgi:pyruvate,water dikinase|nr:phosphoenolpyruvate synthase [Candidatus Thermoplasmatota archaeon]
MTRNIAWIHNVGKGDIAIAGGKGANLGEMVQVGFPVPPAFVLTAQAYSDVVKGTGLGEQVSQILKTINPDDNKALHEASDKIRKLFASTKLPDALARETKDAYKSLSKDADGAAFVAVRSSATAEDLPEASFAGQQDTFLNVRGDDDLLAKVLKCWSSLFTPRAIFYRAKHHFDHDKVNIAVVVQRMVNADKAGVLFTRHPTTGQDTIIVEGALGLGEGVVSGSVSPDNYLVSATGDVLQVTIATQETMYVRGPDGKTAVVKVPADKRNMRVVSDAELKLLARIGKQIEKHYGAPQDIEWAFEGGEVYVLQTRPITTIRGNGLSAPAQQQQQGKDRKLLAKGLGAAPGRATGKVVILQDASELHKVKEGDVLVTPMTMPDMVPAMKRAVAIVTDEGGMTCHAAIVSRELGVPCVVGTKRGGSMGTQALRDGMLVTVDGEKGVVYEGQAVELQAKPAKAPPASVQAAQAASAPSGPAPSMGVAAKPLTATQVKVNISMPEAIDRAIAVEPDGVGLLRIEHIVLAFDEDALKLPRTGRSEGGANYARPVHPAWAITHGHREAYVQFLFEQFKRIVAPMAPRPVWIRTLDFPTDEMRKARGGEDEPHEHNPMLGWRGVRRGLEQPELLKAEFDAVKRLHEAGLTNAGIMLPLVQHPSEIRRAKALLREVGLEPHTQVPFGIMVEIPAAAVIIDLLADEGLDFVSFGTNDLTQYTLAVDRNSENVAHLYDEFHPAVARLIESTIKVCTARGVETSICGQAGSNPTFVEKLVRWGISSVSANIDALPKVRETIARTEAKLVLDRAREGR